MKFANHLFISYARLDNEKTEESDSGWVSRFKDSLNAFLSSALGDEPKIWWDTELRGNEVLPEGIAEELPKTAVLISILSPRYLRSSWCLTEINKFCEIAEAQGGLVVNNKMRICRVMLMPETNELRERLPGPLKHQVGLKDQIGYPFYDKKKNDRLVRVDPRFGVEFKADFHLRVNRVAEELAELINKLNQGENPSGELRPAEPSASLKPVIYLAECSWDREGDRRKISNELRATGYTVVPDEGTRLPDLEEDYAAEVEKSLGAAQLSIHIVGENPSTVLNGPGRKDAVQLQNEIAARKTKSGGVSRLIWLPGGTSTQTQHQRFIDVWRASVELQRGADLIEGNIEGLKNAIRTTLKKIEEPPSRQVAAPGPATQRVYLLCVAADRPATVQVRRFLKDKGLKVEIPVFEGDSATVRQSHEEQLNHCDAVLIFYGAGNEAWKWTTRNDLEKTKSSPDAIRTVFTYLAPPLTAHKQDYLDMGEPNVINALDGFKEAAMQPFLDAMKGD